MDHANWSAWGERRAAIRAAGALCVLMVAVGAGPTGADPASSAGEDMPRIIEDPSVRDWVVDRFAGNSTAGPAFFPGPAREAGGLGRCGACPLPDGRVLIPFARGLAEVAADGVLRLLLDRASLGSGTTGQVTASVVACDPRDGKVYLAGPNCILQLVERPGAPATVKPVAGTPGRKGFDDGPAGSATFSRVDNIVINSRGQMFVLDYNQRLRRIDGGVVTTLNSRFRGGKRADGPLAEAGFALIGLGGNICLGENDETLYVSDHWNFCVRRIDLKAGMVTTVAGMPKPAQWKRDKQTPRQRRYNANCDGPALTWASFNSGCAYVCYDPVHRALWCGGPDEQRLRWLRGGRVLTVLGARPHRKWPRDALGVSAADVRLPWNAVVAVDARGRAYTSCSGEPHGLWRLYNRKEVRP
jgi:hypothetical protein